MRKVDSCIVLHDSKVQIAAMGFLSDKCSMALARRLYLKFEFITA